MKRSELKALIREVIEEATMKTWYVALDRPGAGYSEVVQAPSKAAAIKKVAAMHSSEPPPDTAYEVPADFGQKKPEPKRNFPNHVYMTAKGQFEPMDENFVQEYIEGVEEGIYSGAVYKRITK